MIEVSGSMFFGTFGTHFGVVLQDLFRHIRNVS
jgi:hypothetical protein